MKYLSFVAALILTVAFGTGCGGDTKPGANSCGTCPSGTACGVGSVCRKLCGNSSTCETCEACIDGVCTPRTGCTACTPTDATETSCTGGVDEDCDSDIDCADSDCAADAACLSCTPTAATETSCTGGVDEDCDSDIDCADSDCAADGACVCTPTAGTETSCTGGVDEDCDTDIDCADSDCASDGACVCTPSAGTETSCTGGVDEDCDTDIDCADSDCDGDLACCTVSGTEAGNPADGIDNDCDGLVDIPVLVSRVPAGDEAAPGAAVTFTFATPAVTGWSLQCRTGKAAGFGTESFAPCDGASGTALTVNPISSTVANNPASNGAWRTEVRIAFPGGVYSETYAHTYYIHNTLNGAAACPTMATDAAYFAKAAERLATPDAGTFSPGVSTFVRSPFIKVEYDPPYSSRLALQLSPDPAPVSIEMLSLRRRFVLSPDNKYLLITRLYESRRIRAGSNGGSCITASFKLHDTYGAGVINDDRFRIKSCAAVVLNAAGSGVCLTTDAGSNVQFVYDGNDYYANAIGWIGANKFMYRQLAENSNPHSTPVHFSPKCYSSPTCANASTLKPVIMTYLPDHDVFFP